jgi:transcriptional regulator with XRE-family HTH domain
MFVPLENKIVGQSIAKLRTHRDIKAAEIAKILKLGVAAYTKYERGETAITIPFLNSVAKFFNINPIELISNRPENIVENVHDSNVAMNNGHFTTVDKDLISTISKQLQIKDKQIEQCQNHIDTLIKIVK